MISRSLIFYFIVLMTIGMVGMITAAENSDEDRSVASDIMDNDQITPPEIEIGILADDTENTVVSKQKRRSVKMIVGGQSTDGLAKQVTLPVND